MVRHGGSVWRSETNEYPHVTDDSSFEVSFLEQAQRNVACVSWCSALLLHKTSLSISCVLAFLSTLLYQTSPMF